MSEDRTSDRLTGDRLEDGEEELSTLGAVIVIVFAGLILMGLMLIA